MRQIYLVALLLGANSAEAFATEFKHDLVVYGGTAGGAIAAIAAAGEGIDVALVEPGRHIGGMVSGGLGRTDYGNQAVVGGMSRGFFERLGKHYGEEISWFFEPHVAERILRGWLEEAGVRLFFGIPVESVAKEGARIMSMKMINGDSFSASHFIDASYEGDLMARARISYTWGREGAEAYGESLAGVREFSDKHQFEMAINPFDAEGKLLPLVQEYPLERPGTADRKVQAYNFRLCMTNVPENRVPFPKPDDYDSARWELLARYLQAQPGLTMKDVMNPVMMPNGKTDTNNNGPISSDYIGGSWRYPEADYAERARIFEEHKRYVQGFFYFLQNDPRVPEQLHEEMQAWGLAKDEFVDTGNWPHQLYVREARRMLGAYVMTQKDLQTERSKADSIGMGSYNSDSHHVQRIVATQPGPWGDEVPRVLNEGDMQVAVRPYEIPYGSICPRAEEASNVFVIGAFSASHVAYSSMRMEPQYMILGHAAGIATALARQANVPVQQVDVATLQKRLHEQRAVLSMRDARVPYVQPAGLPGIVVDNDEVQEIGRWRASTTITPYVGMDYLTDVEKGKTDNAVIFRATLPAPGCYEVRVAYCADPNRATNVLVDVDVGNTLATRTINMREKPKEHAPFVSLGGFVFEETATSVTIRPSPEADGYVVADAVQWLPCE